MTRLFRAAARAFGCILACSLRAPARQALVLVSGLHPGIGAMLRTMVAPERTSLATRSRYLAHVSATTHDDAKLVILGDMLELGSRRMTLDHGNRLCAVQDCRGSTGCSKWKGLAVEGR